METICRGFVNKSEDEPKTDIKPAQKIDDGNQETPVVEAAKPSPADQVCSMFGCETAVDNFKFY